MKQRNIQMDVFRGIAIFLIVLGHSSFPGTHFICLFHLVLFFFASGFFFKEEYSQNIDSLKKYIFKRIKRLYIPYIVSNIICILCNNLFLDLKLYNPASHSYLTVGDMIVEIIYRIFLQGQSEMVGATWIMPTLLIISILYALIEFVLKKINIFTYKDIIQFFIGIVFLICGYLLAKNNINLKVIDLPVLTCYIFYDFGRRFKKISAYMNISIKLKFLLICFLGFVLLILNKYGSIELSKNQYTNIFFFMTVSILGCILTYELSYFISKCKFIKKLFQVMGQESLSIMIGHFAIFKAINFMVVKLGNFSEKLIAGFPVGFKGGLWWLVYTFFGIMVPILIKKLIDIIIRRVGVNENKIRSNHCNI